METYPRSIYMILGTDKLVQVTALLTPWVINEEVHIYYRLVTKYML